MDYALLKTIIERVEAYQASHASQKLEDFTIWLNTQLFASENSDPHAADNDLYIGFKLLYAAKELKRQSKGVLSESSLSSIDEYSFLLHLNEGQTFRKMELIELHNLEAPTGIEVIKRLLKSGMIDEYPDEQDKRAKRVVITQRGIEELGHLGPQMDRVFSNASSPLSLNEKIQLSGALDKLIR